MDRTNLISKRLNVNIKKSVELVKEESFEDSEELDYLELKDLFEHNEDKEHRTK